MTPHEITSFIWGAMTKAERTATTFEQEWLRTRVACARLANERVYDKPYLVEVATRLDKDGRQKAYVRTQKGERVRRKIAAGKRKGRSALSARLPTRAQERAAAPPGTV